MHKIKSFMPVSFVLSMLAIGTIHSAWANNSSSLQEEYALHTGKPTKKTSKTPAPGSSPTPICGTAADSTTPYFTGTYGSNSTSNSNQECSSFSVLTACSNAYEACDDCDDQSKYIQCNWLNPSSTSKASFSSNGTNYNSCEEHTSTTGSDFMACIPPNANLYTSYDNNAVAMVNTTKDNYNSYICCTSNWLGNNSVGYGAHSGSDRNLYYWQPSSGTCSHPLSGYNSGYGCTAATVVQDSTGTPPPAPLSSTALQNASTATGATPITKGTLYLGHPTTTGGPIEFYVSPGVAASGSNYWTGCTGPTNLLVVTSNSITCTNA